ncbi:MAG: cyclic nucleotide-binding domain-containing protein [Acidobacteriia bacterium]|nr:cyclic nucleotide-binding domain-containing protein [Terriglobia bacterium]
MSTSDHLSPPEATKQAPAGWGTTLGHGEPLEPDELLKISIFEGVSKGLLEKNRGAVVRRTFRAGEEVCREGEFGSTAFYILDGRAEVFISSPIAHVKVDASAPGFFSRLKSKLVARTAHQRDEESQRRFIPIDAPVDLSYDSPTASLGPGDLFGEMTCMNFYPRSATVRAATDCVMLEMLRNVLDILQKNPKFKAQLDQNYRQRALDDHLRSVPMFANLAQSRNLQQLLAAREFISELRQKVELVRYAPGQVICKQGEPADSFFLIRLGFVRVSQNYPGGEFVLTYLSRGNYFGEVGLLGGGVRTATCTALDHVEVVRINEAEFREMIDRLPDVRKALAEVAGTRQAENQEQLRTVQSVPIGDFLSQGLMEAQNLLVLDLNKCTRCDLCVRACADTHDGITRLVREGLRFDNYLVATSCRQCRDPLCMVGCPVGSIRRRNSLEIIIEDWCVGCGLCAKNCPYGNINMHPVKIVGDAASAAEAVGHAIARPEDAERIAKAAMKKKAITCDLCADLNQPSCVYACPHDAAYRIEPRQFFRRMEHKNRADATRF